MTSTTINDYFREDISNGVDVFAGGKTSIEYKDLTTEESEAIRTVFRNLVNQIRRVSPEIADTFAPQEASMLKWGSIAKALFPDQRSITYPGEAGTIGVDITTPNLFMYNASSSAVVAGQKDFTNYLDKAGYADGVATTTYRGRNWDIKLAKGIPSGLVGTFGASTAATSSNVQLYYSNDNTNNYSFTVLLQDGILETNTTPSVTSFYIKTTSTAKYSPWNVQPLIDQQIEPLRPIYQYKTVGQIPLWHNFGTALAAMPGRSGYSTIPLVGLTFYEYNMFDGPGGSGFW